MIGHVGPPLPCNKIKLVDVPEMEYYAKDGKGEVRKLRRSNLGFWETAHLPLPQVNINTYFSLWEKCWVRGGVGGQFPRTG